MEEKKLVIDNRGLLTSHEGVYNATGFVLIKVTLAYEWNWGG